MTDAFSRIIWTEEVIIKARGSEKKNNIITRKERHVGKSNISFSNRFLSYKKYFLNVIDIVIVLKIFFRSETIYKTSTFVTYKLV